LWWRGIRRIDALIISHADVDHYNAVPSLLRQFSISKVYVSPIMFRPGPDGRVPLAVQTLRIALDRAGVSLHEISDGESLVEGGRCTMRLLHPPREGVSGTDNANSIVLAVEYAGRRILLTGDLERAGIDRLLAKPGYDCDVLLAPHHGSKHSNPPGFAAWSRPEWVVISGGYRVFEEMKSAYRRAGAALLHTARDGAVRVRITEGGLSVHRWRNQQFEPVLAP
jgi:competence protein ComEC